MTAPRYVAGSFPRRVSEPQQVIHADLPDLVKTAVGNAEQTLLLGLRRKIAAVNVQDSSVSYHPADRKKVQVRDAILAIIDAEIQA